MAYSPFYTPTLQLPLGATPAGTHLVRLWQDDDVYVTLSTLWGAQSVAWANITGKPTTIAGYGITVLPWANVTGQPTTLAGYGITNGAIKKVVQSEAPVDAATVVIAANNTNLLLTPAGGLATLTITMPSTSLADGDEVTISCTQAVAAVTHNGGSINGALTALAANGFGTWTYRAAGTAWYRTG